MVAIHAVGAVAVPVGAAILHCNVMKRAVPGANTAIDAVIGYIELAVGY